MITFEKLQMAKEMITQLGCLLDYNYFKNRYKMINKQQALDTDPKAIQQINFTGNLRGADDRIMFFITEEAKETILDFCKRLWKYCDFILF